MKRMTVPVGCRVTNAPYATKKGPQPIGDRPQALSELTSCYCTVSFLLCLEAALSFSLDSGMPLWGSMIQPT